MNEISKEKNKNNYKVRLSLKLNKSKYIPSEEVQCFLQIEKIENENENFDLNDFLQSNEFEIIFQEKIAYIYSDEKSQLYILDKKSLKFSDYKILEDKNSAKISIKYKLPDKNTQDFYPTFRYFSSSIKCIIAHAIQIQLPLKSNKASVNIFIKKLPIETITDKKDELNKIVFKDETIKKYNLLNKGKLSYLIKTKKSLSYKEKLPVEIHIDERDLENIKIESVTIKIKKTIYLYNNIHLYKNSLETYFNMKKIYLNKNSKNNTISENLELPETEFIPIAQRDIQKINNTNQTFNFTPPVNNILFKCEYILQVILNFQSQLIKNKSIDIPLDYYDSQYNNINNNNNDKKEIEENIINDNNINSINNYDDNNSNKFNEVFGKENNDNKNIDKNDNNINDFIEITHEDFINEIDGIK